MHTSTITFYQNIEAAKAIGHYMPWNMKMVSSKMFSIGVTQALSIAVIPNSPIKFAPFGSGTAQMRAPLLHSPDVGFRGNRKAATGRLPTSII
jgi:hypothetical protein